MDHHFLSGTSFFSGLNENEINSILSCLETREKSFKKGAVIFNPGESIDVIGLVTRGSVNIISSLYWGKSSIVKQVAAGNIFGGEYAAIPRQKLLYEISAASDCSVLFIDFKKLTEVCKNVCPFHQILIQNYLRVTAQSTLDLSSRAVHTASKSTRERLMSYFSEQAKISGSVYFTIPFSRQELADYLGVERSALSNTLSKMQKDGLIQYHKNEFKLLKGSRK
ncbi:MAG TPA: Crp/Fnr family transcriptional regulator [Ruminococcaceae bacterium]|nr:Crp/Fnr family transcriptional regulator [Oscillospiraceae bacterium]